MRLARVRGMAVNRIAMGDLAAVRDEIIAPMRRSGADDLTVPVALAESAKEMLPVSADLLVNAHTRALLYLLSSELVRVGAEEGARETELAVGFVDLVDLVKFLGDAAMLVSPDPQHLADTLLAMVEPTDDLAAAPLRAGMALGETLVREGDYFGPAVNMAARLTDQARPWTVLADDDLSETLSERFAIARTKPLRIRGVGIRRPVRVLPPDHG